MKVLLVNGSAKARGCTYTALAETAKALEEHGIETEVFQLGGAPIRDCAGCGQCAGTGRCIYGEDAVNTLIEKAWAADHAESGPESGVAAAVHPNGKRERRGAAHGGARRPHQLHPLIGRKR